MASVNSPHYDYIISHGACCKDGLCAASIAKMMCGNAEVIFACQRGEEISDISKFVGKNVLMTDVMTNNAQEISEQCNLTILDHHKTNKDRVSGEFAKCCTFDMLKCGSVLTWEHFHPGEKMPKWLLYIDINDRWTWDEHSMEVQKEAKQFNIGIDIIYKTIDFDAFHANYFLKLIENCEEIYNEIITVGEKDIARQDTIINNISSNLDMFDAMVKKDYSIEKVGSAEETSSLTGPYKIAFIEDKSEEREVYALRSELGNRCMTANQDMRLQFVVIFRQDPKTGNYYCALRTLKKMTEIDLTQITPASGHPPAAGMTCSVHPSEIFIKV